METKSGGPEVPALLVIGVAVWVMEMAAGWEWPVRVVLLGW